MLARADYDVEEETLTLYQQGGERMATKGDGLGSLLLGLYDDQGLLNHVGFTSSFKAAERKALLKKLQPLIKPPGFTGNAPGRPSRLP